MSIVDADRWAALAPHIDQLLQLAPEERAGWLRTLHCTDAATADQLRALLEARDAASAASFLGGVADATLLPATGAAGDVLGAWTLLEHIGEGGMGSVWRAWRTDGRFEGEAAIKLLRSGLLHPSAQLRFRQEGALLARLRHVGIAQLLDAGVSGRGQPYLILELIAGERIDRWCDARTLSVHARVELVARVADAVAYAHAQLVIHRDLKPANILVTPAGDPKLLDFGIARLTGEGAGAGLTREGALALTPEYAAPEQFGHGTLSVATDVYALGVILHELLVGVHPSGLAGGAPIEYLRAAAEGPRGAASAKCLVALDGRPAARERAACRACTPKQLAKSLSGDLDQVLAKALAPSATERYGSVPELALDLRRFLRSEPVAAHAPSVAYRIGKLLRRRPIESALVAGVVLAIGIGMAATVWQWRIAEAQRRDADRQRARAERMLARSLMANDFTHSLLTEMAQVQRPIRFMDVLEHGERLALDDAGGDPAQRARVLLEIADFRLTGADTARGGPLAKRAAALALAAGDRPLTASAMCEQSLALAEDGEGDAADALAQRAIVMAGDDPEVQARCYTARGWAATAVGRGAQALEYAQRARQFQDRMPWTSASTRVELLDLRATAETLSGDFARADTDFRHALDLLEQAGRGNSLQASTLWNNLANNLDHQGRLLECLAANRKSLQMERDILGDEAVPVANWINIARTLARLNFLDEAWVMAQRGIEKARRVHDEIALFYGPIALATVRREQGRLGEARAQLAEAQHHLGDERPGSIMHVSLELSQARLQIAEGRAGDAVVRLHQLQQDIEQYERVNRTREVSEIAVGTLLTWRAMALADTGRLADAMACARAALALARRQQGAAPLSADTAAALGTLAALEARANGAAAAAATAREAERALAATFGATHPLTRKARAIVAAAGTPL